MATILVVDDEPKITRLVRDYLESAGFTVVTAGDGREALMRARTERPDLVVLDLGLPQLDGLDVTRRLRREGDLPIIMLTARDDETDKLIGLELGADDYVTKPFSPRELVARVRAVLRRHDRDGSDELLRAGALALDVPRMQLEVDGRAVELTATEFSLLAAMARQPGRARAAQADDVLVLHRGSCAGTRHSPGCDLRASGRHPSDRRAGWHRGARALVNRVHYRELTIVGANGSSPDHNKQALALIASGEVPVGDLITHRLPLEGVLDAIGIVSRGEGIKVTIEP